MKFEKEKLFDELVSKCGLNLYLGAGFSVYSYNADGESLPLAQTINEKLIEMFSLDKSRNFTLSKTCQKLKIGNSDLLERVLKETYTVQEFDKDYLKITQIPIKNIVTINIDNLIEKIYSDKDSDVNFSDIVIYGPLEKNNVVNLYKLHGSVTYPMGTPMSFTEKELTDLFVRDPKLFQTVSFKLSLAPTIFWGTSIRVFK